MTSKAVTDARWRSPRTARAADTPAADRSVLSGARRIVVKVGSSSLTSIKGGISEEALTDLADALAHKRNAGTEIILVSSGAIAAGLAPLGLAKRPRDLATQQAAASVGQGLLMARYTHAFGAHGVTVSQVLLTAEDFMRRSQHTNALRALDRLLNLGVVPVVNENDTVATHEIRFGDNDRLAALVAHLVRADALVLLSDVDSLYDGPPAHGAKRISACDGPAGPRRRDHRDAPARPGPAPAEWSPRSRRPPSPPARASPRWSPPPANAAAALAGKDVGTWFSVNGSRKPVRLLWLAHLASVEGTLVLDDGAVKAVRDRRTSLLPAGISAVHGHFEAGDAVEMVAPDGTVIARGLVNYSAAELPQMLGRSTKELGESARPRI